MRARLAAVILLLIAVNLILQFPASATAEAPPSLVTDQSLYTLRDKHVLLQGVGYQPSKAYAVWLQTPVDNSTLNSGLTFTTTNKGEIPPGISLTIEHNSPLGTYLVSVSNSTSADSGIAQAHYGIWSTDRFVYQRTEVVQARGGGVLPKGSLKVTIRNPAGAFVYDATVAANETGAFLASWKIPADAITETYTIFVDGVGTYDYSDKEFVSLSKFSVTPALLNVTVLAQPERLYERMQSVSAQFVVQYPDSKAVTTVKEDLTPAALYAGQLKIADLSLVAFGAASGVWNVQFKTPSNATLETEYKFVLLANSFDDGNGNTGPERDAETSTFSLVPATLRVSSSLNSTHYQVPFDSLRAFTRVSYSDGTSTANATVRAWLKGRDSTFNATVVYDNVAMVWVVTYAFSLGDLFRPGTWTLTVEVHDVYGNAGSESLDIVAEPYVFVAIVIIIVLAVLVLRWFLSRYWRRVYLATKRGISKIKARWEKPYLGRYFSDSPVTPWIRSSLSRPRYLYLNK